MISGKSDLELQFRDIIDGSRSYRAERSVTKDIVKFLKESKTIAMILGGICSGKSLICEECILILQTEGETVYSLQSKFNDLLPEAKKIILNSPDAILAIDNCYSLKADLREIVKTAAEVGMRLLLSSRTLAHDSEEDLRVNFGRETTYHTFDTEVLDDVEGRAIISCTDRISGWGSSVSGEAQKRRILGSEPIKLLVSGHFH